MQVHDRVDKLKGTEEGCLLLDKSSKSLQYVESIEDKGEYSAKTINGSHSTDNGKHNWLQEKAKRHVQATTVRKGFMNKKTS